MILHRLASASFTSSLPTIQVKKPGLLAAPQLLNTFATIFEEVSVASAHSARAETRHAQAPDDHAHKNQPARPSPSRGQNS